MEISASQKCHHQYTDKGYDYVAFEARCGVCGYLLFEFVHQQKYSTNLDRIMAIPPPNHPAGAQSWYKPAVRVIHRDDANGISHEFERAGEGEDRNQVVTSRQMNREEFEKWMEPVQ